MDWSPFLEKVGYFLIISGVAAVAWVAKSIIKPWSDSALKRSEAFVQMVKVLEESVPSIKNELAVLKGASEKSNTALGHNTSATEVLTEELRQKFNSDEIKKRDKELIEQIAAKFNCRAAEVEILMKKHGGLK